MVVVVVVGVGVERAEVGEIGGEGEGGGEGEELHRESSCGKSMVNVAMEVLMVSV